ncbi:RDD family protein [Thiothrix caldifontis]|uniref:RDD family protein n=1 Tax=Thiothrix caldifontis TaxID=525918 RepID=A0A1H4FWB2_9GAMM|nr:RDD family protein [Thiothrix caldifontis]SEB01643.1 RDD family protein [Thiothrix caldifontis]
MKINHQLTPPAKGYFMSHVCQPSHRNLGMRLLAFAFDLLMISLLLMLVLSFVFGQTWLLYHASYENSTLHGVFVAIPLVYFIGFWSLLGATPGKLLLWPWLVQ